MTRYGHSASGAQRWRCSLCNISQVSRINSTAKHLDEFLSWLLSGRRQVDLPGGGRSFRRRCEPLWQLWPVSPIIDEVHGVIFVDGIHLGRCAVVLIAQTPDHVLGWYAARSENSRAWGALMSRIAPPTLVVTDGGSGFATACKKVWPATRVQRCTFHAYCRIRQATTTRPKLEASRRLYALGCQLTHVQDIDGAQEWIGAYQAWCTRLARRGGRPLVAHEDHCARQWYQGWPVVGVDHGCHLPAAPTAGSTYAPCAMRTHAVSWDTPWASSTTRGLVIAALDMAAATRGTFPAGVVPDADRGRQVTSQKLAAYMRAVTGSRVDGAGPRVLG